MSARVGASAVAVTAIVCGRVERLRGFPQAHVFRAEIVAPLRDAMRLVDGEEIDAKAAEEFERVVAHEPLGRDIEQAQRAVFETPRRYCCRSTPSDDGIERGGGDAEFAQLRDLVAHQRDERRDDER